MLLDGIDRKRSWINPKKGRVAVKKPWLRCFTMGLRGPVQTIPYPSYASVLQRYPNPNVLERRRPANQVTANARSCLRGTRRVPHIARNYLNHPDISGEELENWLVANDRVSRSDAPVEVPINSSCQNKKQHVA